MNMPTAYATMEVTPEMNAAGLTFIDVVTYGRKAVRIIRTVGDDCLDALEAGFRAIQAVTRRDLTGILAAFTDAQRSVEKIIAAIEAEFGTE